MMKGMEENAETNASKRLLWIAALAVVLVVGIASYMVAAPMAKHPAPKAETTTSATTDPGPKVLDPHCNGPPSS